VNKISLILIIKRSIFNIFLFKTNILRCVGCSQICFWFVSSLGLLGLELMCQVCVYRGCLAFLSSSDHGSDGGWLEVFSFGWVTSVLVVALCHSWDRLVIRYFPYTQKGAQKITHRDMPYQEIDRRM
jgi:hypothetical protein